jgi:hypothetical protein
MHTPSPLALRGSPVPGLIPEPVRVVDDTLGGSPDRPAAPRRWPPVTNLVARLLSVIRGDKHMAGAYAPAGHAAPPARAEVARPAVRDDVPAGVHPAGTLDSTSGTRGPRTGSQTKEG